MSPRTGLFFGLVAIAAILLVSTPPSRAQQAPATTDPGQIAKQIQEGCVARRREPRVCACGVGIAYAKLEPAAFALIPKIDPLLDEPDRAKQIAGLLGVAGSSRMSVQQVQTAYETIRANRATVRAVCEPLASAATSPRRN